MTTQDPAGRPPLSSKPKPPKKENPFDPHLGWVSMEELHNVFTHELKTLEQLQKHATPEAIFKHVESMKFELFRRAKRNYEDFLKFHPEQTVPAQVADSRDAYQKRIESLRRG